jgi:multiple antibiotic resistance protein
MTSFELALNAFATLFVTIDPVGLAPIFLGVTAGMNRTERYSVAVRGTLIAFCILVAFALVGKPILSTLGITLPAFRIAGGLLLFFIAFEMVFERRQERHKKASDTAITDTSPADIAVFPLAIPLIAGPGAISASILLSTSAGQAWQAQAVIVGVIASVSLLALLSFIAAEFLDKYLGKTGRIVLTRLLGVLLAALAVQFIADGARSIMAG